MKQTKLLSLIILTISIQWTLYGADNPGKSQTIEFDNRKMKHFGDFHIDLPAAWAPSGTENSDENSRTITYTAENKAQSIYLTINYSATGSIERIKSELDIYRKDIILGKTRLHFLRSDGYEDVTHNARFFYHLFEESKQSGFTVTGILSSKTGDKLAVVKLVVSFPKGSPLAGDATEYLKKSTDIVKSFRIEGL